MLYYDESPYDMDVPSKSPFALASIIFGGIALATFSTIYPAIVAASLSIIFGILSRKGTGNLHPLAKGGIACSVFSLVISIVMLVISISYIPKLLQDETFRNQISTTLESIYGTELDTDAYLNLWMKDISE